MKKKKLKATDKISNIKKEVEKFLLDKRNEVDAISLDCEEGEYRDDFGYISQKLNNCFMLLHETNFGADE